MEWKVDYLEKDGIVFTKMLSPINFESTKQLCIEVTLLAREYQTRKYLVDHRGVDIVFTVLDIDKIPGAFKEIGADFNSKTAILLDSSMPKVNLFHFLKNVLRLASMHFELFFDKDEAIAWLRSVH